MKRRLLAIFPISVMISFVFHATSQATEYWGPEELNRHHEENRPIMAEPLLPPQVEASDIDTTYYLRRFAMVAEFLTTLQVAGDTLPNYGGMREGELQTNIIQTDNTQEAIWIWSRYTDLTGDTTYVPNIEAAWVYVMNNPSYNEEGGSGELGYYRVYNCAWAMAAEMEYRRVFGDSTFLWYSDSSANYVINNPLNLYGPEPYDVLNGMVTGWAVGNLYSYSESTGDTTFSSEATSIGLLVKEWAEGDPAARLGGWEWAMSGGAAFWGITNSYFRHYPDGLRLWSETYDDYLQIYVPEGNWQNAWNLWFILGNYTAWDSQGDLQQQKNQKMVVEFLISLDGGGDGGIGHSDENFDINEQ